MQTASFTSLMETIFYILVAYYVFKILARMFLPVVVRKVASKAEESFRQQYQQQQPRQEPAYTAPKNDKPRSTKIVGEYVDFEEIE